MHHRRLLLFALLATSRAYGLDYHVGSIGGVMQQPSSQYYNAIYGAYFDLATEKHTAITRAVYVERPKFSANGYADQEWGYFGMIGRKITKDKNHGLYTFVGGGSMQGYIEKTSNGKRNSYSMPGMSLVLEYGATFRFINAAFSHSMFVGYASSDQFEARVLWPYSYFMVNLGYAVGGKG